MAIKRGTARPRGKAEQPKNPCKWSTISQNLWVLNVFVACCCHLSLSGMGRRDPSPSPNLISNARKSLVQKWQKDSRKLCKIVRESHFCAKIVQKLCSHNFHAILGRGDSEVPKMFLHKFCAFFLSFNDKASCTGNKYLKSRRSHQSTYVRIFSFILSVFRTVSLPKIPTGLTHKIRPGGLTWQSFPNLFKFMASFFPSLYRKQHSAFWPQKDHKSI